MDECLGWLVEFVGGYATSEQARHVGYGQQTMRALRSRGFVVYEPIRHLPDGEWFNAWVLTNAGRARYREAIS